jgi:hypothetical protein
MPQQLGFAGVLEPYRGMSELSLGLGSIDHNFGGTLAKVLHLGRKRLHLPA